MTKKNITTIMLIMFMISFCVASLAAVQPPSEQQYVTMHEPTNILIGIVVLVIDIIVLITLIICLVRKKDKTRKLKIIGIIICLILVFLIPISKQETDYRGGYRGGSYTKTEYRNIFNVTFITLESE